MATTKEVMDRFVQRMQAEIAANYERKGPFNDWKPCKDEALHEFTHHYGKLCNALSKEDLELVEEHCADCANILMKIFERFGKMPLDHLLVVDHTLITSSTPLPHCPKCGPVEDCICHEDAPTYSDTHCRICHAEVEPFTGVCDNCIARGT